MEQSDRGHCLRRCGTPIGQRLSEARLHDTPERWETLTQRHRTRLRVPQDISTATPYSEIGLKWGMEDVGSRSSQASATKPSLLEAGHANNFFETHQAVSSGLVLVSS